MGEHWNGHCQEHLSAITSKRCGSITYCHTLVRPGYCPFHLSDERLPASERWESWTRDRKLWVHLDEHINKVEHWPSPCPHPLCDLSVKDAAEMRYHFIDDHGMCRTRLNVAVEHTTTLGGKRKRSNSTAQLEWVDSLTVQESPDATKSRRRLTKSPQEASPTICPKLLGSPLGQTLGQDLFAGVVFDSTLTSDCTDFEFADRATSLESEANIQKREWQANSPDHFGGSATDTYVDSDTLFSDYLHSRSPSISILETQDCNAEPTVGLFDRTSALTPSTAPCPAAFMDNNLNRLHEERQVKPDGRRIQLRIKPPKAPKITLRLTRPKRVARATGNRKRA